MPGIKNFIKRLDYTVSVVYSGGHETHLHQGNQAYLQIENAIKTKETYPNEPIQIFQAGDGVPKGISNVPDRVWWISHWIPYIRNVLKRPHRRGSKWGWLLGWKGLFVWIPLMCIMFFLLWQLTGHHIIQAVHENIENLENHIIIIENGKAKILG